MRWVWLRIEHNTQAMSHGARGNHVAQLPSGNRTVLHNSKHSRLCLPHRHNIVPRLPHPHILFDKHFDAALLYLVRHPRCPTPNRPRLRVSFVTLAGISTLLICGLGPCSSPQTEGVSFDNDCLKIGINREFANGRQRFCLPHVQVSRQRKKRAWAKRSYPRFTVIRRPQSRQMCYETVKSWQP